MYVVDLFHHVCKQAWIQTAAAIKTLHEVRGFGTAVHEVHERIIHMVKR